MQEQQQGAGGDGGKGGWDSSIFSKEEMSAMTRSREEAALKRVRALQYASTQNVSYLSLHAPQYFFVWMDADNATAHVEQEKRGVRRWSWLEEWVGAHQHQPPFDKDIPVAYQSPYRDVGCSARRSFVRPRRTPARDPAYCHDEFPGYMASTASAKAKSRSMSTPKERSSDAYSEQCFPFADRMLSPIPSIVSDMGFARPPVTQRSPRVVKGPMTPARSRSRRRSPSHHSFGSEAALHQLQLDHYTPVR
jgi:hypothetical protein